MVDLQKHNPQAKLGLTGDNIKLLCCLNLYHIKCHFSFEAFNTLRIPLIIKNKKTLFLN